MAAFFVEVALSSNKITVARLGNGARCVSADEVTRHLDRNGGAYEWSDAETARVDNGRQLLERVEGFLANIGIPARRVSGADIIIGPFAERSFKRARGMLAIPELQVVETGQSAAA
ncbi:hypothetical protein [Bradyrhizobium manausense]|uniref:Uncharacterized protein n=1 Tax=Bradyrhizobium manausense TaxID=989370 RepID=A0A0R3DK10_9BRAD|nr:hypothetical protein [Bradyrhizobium manausense]KRQ10167.1 hypothetical protein AOQ71_19550 [Bradyrhizobium manausense]